MQKFILEATAFQAYIRNFGEEVVRGQPAFVLAMLLRWLAPALRETAGVSSWQVRGVKLVQQYKRWPRLQRSVWRSLLWD